MNPVTIEQLWVYPVKSLAGIPLNVSVLQTTGLANDREWMIVDGNGRFVTQRQLPQLATIKTALREDELFLSHARAGEIAVPQPTGESVSVKVWRDDCRAFAAAEHINQWLQEALGHKQPLSLVCFDKRQPRPTNPERFGDFHTFFSDGAPFLVANIASLRALNERLLLDHQTPVDIRRFRPSIVVSGLPAFAEHHCRYLRRPDSDAVLGLKDHCQRCSVITVDQSTGVPSSDTQPFKTLAQINSMPGNPKAPAFGVNSVLTAGAGSEIRCGEQWMAAS